MAKRKLMKASKIEKKFKIIYKEIRKLGMETELLSYEIEHDNVDLSVEEYHDLFVEEYIWADGGIYDILSKLYCLLIEYRKKVRKIRRIPKNIKN